MQEHVDYSQGLIQNFQAFGIISMTAEGHGLGTHSSRRSNAPLVQLKVAVLHERGGTRE